MSDVLDLQRLRDRERGIQKWIKENHPTIQSEQKHLDEGSTERAYWHYGYMVGVRDVLNFLTRGREDDKNG
jgi:hypothetical protein